MHFFISNQSILAACLMTGVKYSCVCLPVQYFGSIFWQYFLEVFWRCAQYDRCRIFCLCLPPFASNHDNATPICHMGCKRVQKKKYKEGYFYSHWVFYLWLLLTKILNYGCSRCLDCVFAFLDLWCSSLIYALMMDQSQPSISLQIKFARCVKTNASFWFWKPYKPKWWWRSQWCIGQLGFSTNIVVSVELITWTIDRL